MSGFDIAIMDYWATSGRSRLHRAGPAAKVVMTACFIAAVLITLYVPLLGVLYVALAALLLVARLPVLKVATIGAYPVVFAALLIVSAWDGTWQTPALILGRALTAALSMVTLLATTPYPQVFKLASRFLPRLVSEGLLLTYRAVFILLDMAGDLVTATKVRAGVNSRHPRANLRNLSQSLGKLLVAALDRSEREYDIMVVRGYDGHIAAAARAWNGLATDAPPVIIGLLAIAAAVWVRWIR